MGRWAILSGVHFLESAPRVAEAPRPPPTHRELARGEVSPRPAGAAARLDGRCNVRASALLCSSRERAPAPLTPSAAHLAAALLRLQFEPFSTRRLRAQVLGRVAAHIVAIDLGRLARSASLGGHADNADSDADADADAGRPKPTRRP